MSSLALMRWLEATPDRYDAGMRAITLGRVTRLHDAVARTAAPEPGCEVLEIGCGTGAVTARMLARGARVTALDQSPEMLERARQRIADGAEGRVQWIERTAAEIDALPPAAFDRVVLCLSLSEMSATERRYVLAHARDRLRPGGRLVAADEVVAPGPAGVLQRLLRAPQWLLGWLLSGSVSRPIADLRGELETAGLVVGHEERWLFGTLALFVAEPGS